MITFNVRNVHQALPVALKFLRDKGIERQSRNGPVLTVPHPVVTCYRNPMERVLFWPERDANPFFHLYEALWMLAGRRDLKPLMRYVGDFGKFSDDGETLHGAYGYRWRHHFGRDQLATIINRLKADPDDRRSQLQMWDARVDLDRVGKDVPCNTEASFQLQPDNTLDLTVFCRSNDIIWGAYGANAVHFAFLLEYVALGLGAKPGHYYQVSVNWHAYKEQLAKLDDLIDLATNTVWSVPAKIENPYDDASSEQQVYPLGMGDFEDLDWRIQELLAHTDTGFAFPKESNDDSPFFDMAYKMLRAHHVWKSVPYPERFERASAILHTADLNVDWIAAGQEWFLSRYRRWENKMMVGDV